MSWKYAPWLLAVLIAGCASIQTQLAGRAGAAAPDDGWMQWRSPAEAGFDSAALEQARARADRAQSAAVMAVYRGRVLVAWGDVEREMELHSVRKSLYAALYGIAQEKGFVDLGATLRDLGVDDIEPLTDFEKQATLENLLQARSGVYHPAAYAPADQDEERPARGTHSPGTFWFYNNWDFNVAGALLERFAGEPLAALFGKWIAEPIGLEDYDHEDVFAVVEPSFSRWPALTFRMSTRDLARFGLLWLNRGRWNMQQVIPADWIDRASHPASAMQQPGAGYAMMWWTFEPGAVSAQRYPHASRYTILQARGTGGQAVFILPAADLVVVHRGDTDHGRRVPGGEVWAILDEILGARRSEPVHSPQFVRITPVPLESQLPPLEWPRTVLLDAAELDAVAGEYQFRPGMVGRVYVHQGRLFAFMPGQGEAELFATSPTEFLVRVDPSAAVRFESDGGPLATRIRVRIGGRELVGTRVKP